MNWFLHTWVKPLPGIRRRPPHIYLRYVLEHIADHPNKEGSADIEMEQILPDGYLLRCIHLLGKCILRSRNLRSSRSLAKAPLTSEKQGLG